MNWIMLGLGSALVVGFGVTAVGVCRRLVSRTNGGTSLGGPGHSSLLHRFAALGLVAVVLSGLAVALVPTTALAISTPAIVLSTNAAGSTAMYTVSFNTTVPLNGTSDSITLSGPAFSSTGTYTVNMVSYSAVWSPNSVTITPTTIIPAGQVTVTATAVANPTSVGSYTLTVGTTAESGTASGSYSIGPGPADHLIVPGSSTQSVQVGTPFATLSVQVVDLYGNNVSTPPPGLPVSFAAPSSGASGSFTYVNPAATGSTGVASEGFTANAIPGSYQVVASAPGLGSASFSLTNTVGAATNLVNLVGWGQSVKVGTRFPTTLSVTVEDSLSNPVSGAHVTFTAPSSGASGTFSGSSTVTTGANGVAAAPAFTANGTAGIYSVTASTGGASTSFVLANITLPSAPTIEPAISEDGSAKVRWAAPASNGFNTISGYVITCSNGAVLRVGAVTDAIFPGLVNGLSYSFAVAAVNAAGTGPSSATSNTVVPRDTGYWLVASDGGIFSFGTHNFHGSTGAIHLNRPIVDMATTPNGAGYWLVAADGGVFAFGNARFYGSTGGIHLNKPIVGMAATADGNGYWLVASDGGVFAFGDARFHGSTGGKPLNKPIVGMAATTQGSGYWLVASDGGIFAFGSAKFSGSTGALHLDRPVVGMAATPTSHGYWLVASDGGIFAFGDAGFYGSTGGKPLNRPIVGMTTTPIGHGYLLVGSDGGIFAFGDASFQGSTGATRLNQPIVGIGA